MKKFAILKTVFLSLTMGYTFAGCSKTAADPWIDYKESDPNPIVERLSDAEIKEGKTPASVAYNFVNAILEKDFNKMLENTSYEWKEALKFTLSSQYNGDVSALLEENFSDGKLGVYTWLPALEDGHEVTVAFIQDESNYMENGRWSWNPEQVLRNGEIYLPGDDRPHKARIVKKIYITCSPSSEIGSVGFQDISRYGDTNVKVLLVYEDGEWKVEGFK